MTQPTFVSVPDYQASVDGSAAARGRTTQFSRECLADVWDDAQPLLQAHYEEIAHYPDIPLSPDRDAYEAMERLGMLRVFTLRQAGRLVGYAVYFVKRSMHYASSFQAYQDILYVVPELRGRTAGAHLILKADAALKEEGVQVVHQHMKAAHPFGPLLERIGYELVDYVYSRRLD